MTTQAAETLSASKDGAQVKKEKRVRKDKKADKKKTEGQDTDEKETDKRKTDEPAAAKASPQGSSRRRTGAGRKKKTEVQPTSADTPVKRRGRPRKIRTEEKE